MVLLLIFFKKLSKNIKIGLSTQGIQKQAASDLAFGWSWPTLPQACAWGRALGHPMQFD